MRNRELAAQCGWLEELVAAKTKEIHALNKEVQTLTARRALFSDPTAKQQLEVSVYTHANVCMCIKWSSAGAEGKEGAAQRSSSQTTALDSSVSSSLKVLARVPGYRHGFVARCARQVWGRVLRLACFQRWIYAQIIIRTNTYISTYVGSYTWTWTHAYRCMYCMYAWTHTYWCVQAELETVREALREREEMIRKLELEMRWVRSRAQIYASARKTGKRSVKKCFQQTMVVMAWSTCICVTKKQPG